MSLTDAAARELITRGGLDRTLFVEAGAGTGKTTQLVERVASLVIADGVPLASIAAITFTEAAAAELADRIRVTFERRAAETGDALVRDRCRTALDDADRAAISTLHSFAARILGDHPLAAGLPPRVGILDEISSELAHEARWERFVDGLYDDPANEELLLRAVLVGAPLEPRYPGHATLKGAALILNQSWDRLGGIAAAVPAGPLAPIDFGPFDRAVTSLEVLNDGCLLTDTDKYHQHLRDTLLPEVRALRAETDPERKFRVLHRRKRGWGRGPATKAVAWNGGVEAAKAGIEALNDSVRVVLDEASGAVLTRLLPLVARHVLDAAEARRSGGRLEFHDLLVLARRLLRTSPETRWALHQRFTHLLLDEFQDTDPIQVELAVLIASSVAGTEPPAWWTIDVDAGRLFFVGDPKQSIYRFRRADITLFLDARDRFAPDGTQVRLTTNFRTVAPVLSWVNDVFGRLMPDEVPGSQPRYEPLDPHRAPSPAADHRPVLLGGPHARLRAGELREVEAVDVARAVDHIRRHPDQWSVGEPGGDRWRPARLTDVTILLPTRTSLPFLRAALDARGLPYRLDTGTLVYETQEVRDALGALAAIDDPSDELSLVAALRSPLYACSDLDLFAWRHAGGRFRVGARRPDGIAADHPVAAALTHLEALAQDRWWVRPSMLLGRLLAERRAAVIGFAGGSAGGAANSAARAGEVWGRLRFLVDQARAYEEAGGGGGLRGFVEWAALQRSESARVHEPMLPETDSEAVRIMTIHGAKGLEFPITVLSGMTTRPMGTRPGVSVLWNDAGDPEVSIRKGVATANHDARADLEAEMDVHEKLRLLYVGATRARDHLIVAGHHVPARTPADRSYAATVWETAQEWAGAWRTLANDDDAGADPVPRPARAGPAEVSSGLPEQDDREEWLAGREALLAVARRPRFVSATAIARAAGQAGGAGPEPVPPLVGSADDTDPDDAEAGAGDPDGSGLVGAGADDRDPPVTPRRRGRAGTAVGRAVHATLQFTDLVAPAGVGEQAARQAALEAVPEASATIAALARSALASEAVGLAAKWPHHKEVYVAAPVGGRIIEGYVDLLVETDAGLVIVDYKTDTVGSEADVAAKIAAYELQGAAYAVAVEAATGLPVVECRFVFCHAQGAIERHVADLTTAKSRVRAHLAG